MYAFICIYVCVCVYVYVHEWFYNILRVIFNYRISRILQMSNTTNITHGSNYDYDICVNNINHGYLWCNILLSMKDWRTENKDFSILVAITQWMYSSRDSTFCIWTTTGRSWQYALSFFEWVRSTDWEFCNSLQNELLVSSRVLYCMEKRSWGLNSVVYFDCGLYIWEMWLIMNRKGCRIWRCQTMVMHSPPYCGFIWEKL